MAKRWQIEVRQECSAPPPAVWPWLADVTTWRDWGPFSRSELETAAPGPDPNGVGAIRRFRAGRTTSREEVIGFEPGRRYAYRLISGLDVRDYRAEVVLEPTPAGGSIVAWRSSFARGRWTSARVMRWLLSRFIRRVTAGLVAAAETAELRGGARP